jgi:hypothetical protein
MVAKYRRTVAGFLPSSAQASMKEATVEGDAGNGSSPLGLQKPINAAQSNRRLAGWPLVHAPGLFPPGADVFRRVERIFQGQHAGVRGMRFGRLLGQFHL